MKITNDPNADYRTRFFISYVLTLPGLAIYFFNDKTELAQGQVPIIWFWVSFIAGIVAVLFGFMQMLMVEKSPVIKLTIGFSILVLAVLYIPFIHWWLTLN